MEIFIDIETIPAGERPTDAELRSLIPGSISKEETIAKWIAENREGVFRKRALDPFQGQILCVVVAIQELGKLVKIIDKDERVVLQKLFDYLEANIKIDEGKPRIIGHNVTFDINFLFIRGLKHNIDIKKYLPSSVRDYNNYYCTMKAMVYGESNKFASLEKSCHLLNIPVKTGMHGSQVYDFYMEDKLDEIAEYCKEDVLATMQLYQRLNS